MISIQIKIFLYFIFITSFPFTQAQINYDYVLEVNKKLPKFGFVIEKIENDTLFNNYIIKIYQAESNKFIQSFNMINYDIYYSKYEDSIIDSLIDMNFDNYKDLCVYAGSGQNGKNEMYSIFLYDSLKGEFYKNPSFDFIYNFTVDYSTKSIDEFFWTRACTNDCIIWNTYIVINNKLTLVKSDYNEYDSKTNTMHRFIETYKNGKLVSKKEVGLEEDVK
jgi:hypothetical protein